jgi:hypothetical protein
MNRELNTKQEMARRLAYVAYVVCLFFCFLFAVRGIAQERAEEILASGILGFVAFLIRQTGVQHLEFRRLARSFPLGSAEDRLSRTERMRIEALIREFHKTEDWTRRQEIRRSLGKIVQDEPLLKDAYRSELSAVHPTLFQKAIVLIEFPTKRAPWTRTATRGVNRTLRGSGPPCPGRRSAGSG